MGTHRYWFPLALLGFGLLVLLGWESLRYSQDINWFAYAPANAADQITVYGTAIEQGFVAQRYPMRDSSWAVLVIVVLIATTAWYGLRARRAGESIRIHVMTGMAGTIAVIACYLSVAIADSMADTGMVAAVSLPLFGLGVLAGAWAYLRPGPSRRPVAALGIGCLAVGLGTALGVWEPGLVDPILIVGGLLVLARCERSRILAVAACAVFVAMVAVPTGTFSMLLPATLLLLAGLAALVVRQNPATA